MKNNLASAAEADGMSATGTPGSAADEAIRQGLAGVAGLDVQQGLAHLRNRMASYIRVLHKFAATRADDVELMRAHVAARDYAALSASAHHVKGIAGFLGATGIERLAAEVSAAVRAQRSGAEIDRLAGALIDAQTELQAAVLPLIDQLHGSNG